MRTDTLSPTMAAALHGATTGSRQDHFLIGLTGRAGAGKDTCAEILAHYGFRALAFADPLRDEVCEAYGVPRSVLVQRTAKETPQQSLAVVHCRNLSFRCCIERLGYDTEEPRSPRWVMQRWGTEFRREQNPRYWISQWERRVQTLRAAGRHRLIVTDVRFANEAESLQHLGGHLLQVHRPELRALEPDSTTHASEPIAPLPADDVIHNDGDREHLHAEVVRVVSRFGSLAADLAMRGRT